MRTSTGVLSRTLAPATPLPFADRYGNAAELATREPAAVWGMPDFVLLPEVRTDTSGSSSELGDLIFVAGDFGAVVQVKAREEPSTSVSREISWCQKSTAKALRQANGTIGALKRRRETLTNMRGERISVSGCDLAWQSIVVLEHDRLAVEHTPDVALSRHPATVLSRRDWDFLWKEMKSTAAVLAYLRRVSGDPVPLDREWVRYLHLARAKTPAGDDDAENFEVFRLLMEEVALMAPEEISATKRLRLLADLDRLPGTDRSTTGAKLIMALAECGLAEPGGLEFKAERVIAEEGALHLVFGAASVPWDDRLKDELSNWIMVRHHDLALQTGNKDLVSTGVFITPRADGMRSYDTMAFSIRAPVEFDSEDLVVVEEIRRRYPAPSGPGIAGSPGS